MTKKSHSATQGQPFSTQDRGKLDEKSVQTDTNTDLCTKTAEKTEKPRENSGDFDKKSDDLRHRVEDFSKNTNETIENATKNQEKSDFNSDLSIKSAENESKSAKIADTVDISEDFDSNLSKSQENSDNLGKNQKNSAPDSEKAPTSDDILTFEGQIDRDYGDFSKNYPNVSKSALLSDKSLRSFASGKENQPLVAVYSDFCSLVHEIEQRVLKESAHRLSVEKSSVGALSSSKSAEDAYFSREQVQRMSADEIKRNYKRIRESQARW